MIQTFDYTVLSWIQEHLRSDWLTVGMTFFTTLGDKGFLWLLTAAILFCFPKTRKNAIVLLITLAANFLLGEILLKHLAARLRPIDQFPELILLIPHPGGYSFPSSHSSSSFAGAVILFHVDKRLGAVAIATAALIAFSRIYFLVHFPTDILTGAILGIVLASFANRFLLPRLEKN